MVSPALVLADDLPPPPTEMSAIAEATLYLDLVVNQICLLYTSDAADE